MLERFHSAMNCYYSGCHILISDLFKAGLPDNLTIFLLQTTKANYCFYISTNDFKVISSY